MHGYHGVVQCWIGLSCLALFACGSEAPEVEVETGILTQALIGNALPGLNAAQRARFDEAADTFAEEEGVADGLGPVFNERGCGNCHSVGALGGSGTQFETRAGKLTGNVFDPLTAQGGQLFDLFSVTNPTLVSASDRALVSGCTLPINGEPVPAAANVNAQRRTTALFGLGLVDATPDAALRIVAAAEPSAVRGRLPQVDNLALGHKTAGKFGWKSQVASLQDFSGDAYLNEMGITNPAFPVEQAPSGDASTVAACDGKPVEPGTTEDDGEDVELFTDFMRFLAPPARLPLSAEAIVGDALFSSVGCDGCHKRKLISGFNTVSALSLKVYEPFSDFLLHDMGSLGDNIVQGDAKLKEMRTAPLWGLRFVAPENLLHDGRATSLSDAILQHDGQALTARNAFSNLSDRRKNALLAFLNTL
jgi:CxxC motif-containing protein (DUF1111 family)